MPSHTAQYQSINFRETPERYGVGKGEVLLAEPHKSELLPHGRFRTPAMARESAEKICALYQEYKAQEDFVGIDMARKFLRMGHTRSRRYANPSSGRKYKGPVPLEHKGQSGAWGPEQLPPEPDRQKAASAAILEGYYLPVLKDPDYQGLNAHHKAKESP